MDKNGQRRGGDRSAAAAANGRQVGPRVSGAGKKEQQSVALSAEVWAYLSYQQVQLQARSQGAALEEVLRSSEGFQDWQRKREKAQQ